MKILFPALIILLGLLIGSKNKPTSQKEVPITSDNITTFEPKDSTILSKELDSVILKCNVDIVLRVQNHLDSLSVKEIIQFLKVFSIGCRNNIEFSEFSNEVLFEVMDRQPKRFIEAICETHTDIEYKAIYKQIKSPLYDLIPLDKIKKSVKSTPQRCERIDSVLKYLDYAAKKLR
jgi:hemerythrin-like domain-containing protein